jgi:uncharacterized membrane protein YfcA
MKIVALLLVGLAVGGVSGMFGIGGGILLVPILVWFFGFDYSRAAGTTLAMLSMPIALPAAWKYFANRRMDLEAAVCIAAAFAVGGYFGAAAVPHVPERFLRFCFGLLMIYLGGRFLVSSNTEAAQMAAGLTALVLGWGSYWLLRTAGRRLAPPSLAAELRRAQELSRGEPDYSI